MLFFKESIKEFEHVVWPTPEETKKYFNVVVSMIVLLAILLFIVGTLFSTGLFTLKQKIQPIRESSVPISTSSPTSPTKQDLKLDGINMETTPSSTTTSTPVTTPTQVNK